MRNHADPTAERALGAVQREWNRMEALAQRIRLDPWSDWAMREKRRFTGIYRRLLTDPDPKPERRR